MQKMQLVIDNFDEYAESLPLWSTLYIKMNSLSFPCAGWTDATSSVLLMWFDNMLKFMSGSYEHITLYFMDGDYSIELLWQNSMQAIAHFKNPNNIIILQETIDLCYFSRQMLSAVGKLTKHYNLYASKSQISDLKERSLKLKEYLLAMPT